MYLNNTRGGDRQPRDDSFEAHATASRSPVLKAELVVNRRLEKEKNAWAFDKAYGGAKEEDRKCVRVQNMISEDCLLLNGGVCPHSWVPEEHTAARGLGDADDRGTARADARGAVSHPALVSGQGSPAALLMSGVRLVCRVSQL